MGSSDIDLPDVTSSLKTRSPSRLSDTMVAVVCESTLTNLPVFVCIRGEYIIIDC